MLRRFLNTLKKHEPALICCFVLFGSWLAPRAQAADSAVTVASSMSDRSDDLLKRARAGDTDAQYQLANRLRTGDGARHDELEAFHWYQQAAKSGHADAQLQLALMYLESDEVPTNQSMAWEWLDTARRNGHPLANNVQDYILSYDGYDLGC